MKMFERLREWASSSDDEKMQMDRRAFLKGMAVTSAGVLVPGATVFDLAQSSREIDARVFLEEWVNKIDLEPKLREVARMQNSELLWPELRVFYKGIEMRRGEDSVTITEQDNGFHIKSGRFV